MQFASGKSQFSFLETVTSGTPLVLVASSPQIQILTGSSNQTVRLPDATTTSSGNGIAFSFINLSSGIATILLNDNSTTLMTIAGGASADALLTLATTSNGVWRPISFTGGGGGGGGSVAPGSTIVTTYSVLVGDNGRVINLDSTGGSFNVQLPSPTAGFLITFKDVGNASLNPITLVRAGSETIDGQNGDFTIGTTHAAITLMGGGTNWFMVGGFKSGDVLGNPTGFLVGDDTVTATIHSMSLVTIADTAFWADMNAPRSAGGASASSTRGIYMGGGGITNIDYFDFASKAKSQFFGQLTVNRNGGGGASNSTRSVYGGGANGVDVASIDFVTIASIANATLFGNLSVARAATGGLASQTRAVFAGGDNGVGMSVMDFIVLASTGNASSFGSLQSARELTSGVASATRGIFAGGFNPTQNVMDLITIASASNSSAFGTLSSSRYGAIGMSSTLRGFYASGGPSSGSVIDYVNIAVNSNAFAWGALVTNPVASGNGRGCSNAHGGL